MECSRSGTGRTEEIGTSQPAISLRCWQSLLRQTMNSFRFMLTAGSFHGMRFWENRDAQPAVNRTWKSSCSPLSAPTEDLQLSATEVALSRFVAQPMANWRKL